MRRNEGETTTERNDSVASLARRREPPEVKAGFPDVQIIVPSSSAYL
jgi:hypothetical protein